MEHSVIWRDGALVAAVYDDIYFSKENGLDETRHVFLLGNNLPSKWRENPQEFHIIETGFGTGLNFFACLKLWCDLGCTGRLYYSSVELHPLKAFDIQRAVSLWPELEPYLQEFLLQYTSIKSQESLFTFLSGKVQLRILWRDVSEALLQITDKADAWFLDGFAPAKNPQMWQENLYQQMAVLSKTGSSFATFTAAGKVRRGLVQNGFIVNKIPGFGHKRHVLVGRFCHCDEPNEVSARKKSILP